MPFFKRSLSGPGYVVLNIIRVCNIIALIAIVAASFGMLVKTFQVSKFFFFDAITHLITGCLALALIITEIGMFRRYIANNWPLFCPASGFITLGVTMIILGVSVLGNLNKSATSEQSLGTTIWQLVIASGIVVSIMGVLNICANYMFREKSMDVTARQVRAHGSTAPQKTDAYLSPSMSTRTAKTSRRSFHLNRRSASESLPSYKTEAQQPGHRNISAPVMATSPVKGRDDAGVPVVNGVQRPDLAFHPAFQGQQF